MISQHPEVLDEMQAIQQALHGYVLAHQVAPPDGLREKIVSGARPAPPPAAKRSGSRSSGANPSPKTLKVEVDTPPVNWWIVLAIAAVLGLVAAGIFAMNKISDLEETQKELATARAEAAKLKLEKDAQTKLYETTKTELDLRSDHNLQPIRILGTNRAPEASAVVYWNGAAKKCYLDVRKLPGVPEGQQLQLWVTANGKTQNLGTPKPNLPNELPELKFIDNPSTYFVTLEKAGDAPAKPSRWRVLMVGRVNF